MSENNNEVIINPKLGEKKGNFLTEWVLPFCMALVVFLIFNQFIGISRVAGESMWPTLTEGNVVIINKTAYSSKTPEVGDIVVFHSDLENNESAFQEKKDLIKRVVGVEGDHVVVSGGEVFINEVKIDEDYLADGIITIQDVDIVVPEGHYFCMGDNRLNSLDSRYPQIGPVPKEAFVGKVIYQIG